MPPLENERFYPADADELFSALRAAVGQLYKVKGADQFSRSVTFTTPAAGFSWGATMSAQVIPASGGASVRVGGTQKMRANITAQSAEYKNTIRLFDAVSAHVQSARMKPPSAGWYSDPHGADRQRYWDGERWTDHYSPKS